MENKICPQCKITKGYQDFSICVNRKDGLACWCKYCDRLIHKISRQKNIRFYRAKNKINYDKNRSKILQRARAWRAKNKQKLSLYFKKHYQLHKLEKKQYNLDNKKHILKQLSRHNKIKCQTNIQFKLSRLIRSRILQVLKRNTKSGHTLELLGCSVEFLKKHLESKFKSGMTWDNHGFHGWHIDHIRPCSSFDLLKPEEQAKCFHYTNLQPLWAEENLKKKDKYENPNS